MSSQLKVNSIRDTSNNEALSISSGNVSFNNTISAGTIGSSVAVQSGFGVTDITSSFTRDSNWSQAGEPDSVFHFNGFVFYNLGASKSSTPGNFETVWTIATSYRPSQNYHCTFSTYQGDTSHNVSIQTSGIIQCVLPTAPTGSDATFRVIINGWYKL